MGCDITVSVRSFQGVWSGLVWSVWFGVGWVGLRYHTLHARGQPGRRVGGWRHSIDSVALESSISISKRVYNYTSDDNYTHLHHIMIHYSYSPPPYKYNKQPLSPHPSTTQSPTPASTRPQFPLLPLPLTILPFFSRAHARPPHGFMHTRTCATRRAVR